MVYLTLQVITDIFINIKYGKTTIMRNIFGIIKAETTRSHNSISLKFIEPYKVNTE